METLNKICFAPGTYLRHDIFKASIQRKNNNMQTINEVSWFYFVTIESTVEGEHIHGQCMENRNHAFRKLKVTQKLLTK